jgi:hypothetical protein
VLSKCANPECFEEFDFRRGSFFCFPDRRGADLSFTEGDTVRHFWLCSKCAECYVIEASSEDHFRLQARTQVQQPHKANVTPKRDPNHCAIWGSM